MLRRLALVLMVGIVASGPALAASPQVRISKLSDVSLAPANITVDAVASQSICIFRNAGSGGIPGGYSVTASGSGPGSAFSLQAAGVTPRLPYSVLWNDSAGQTSGTALSPGAVSLGHITTQTASQNCSSGPSTSASLIIQVLTGDLQAAVGGVTYSGTLTLAIAPQ